MYYSFWQTEKICEELGDHEQAKEFSLKKEEVANAFNKRFFDKKNGEYCKGAQGANVLPLLFGIVEAEHRTNIEKKVIEKYETDPHFDTGIVLTPKLLELLTRLNRSDLAYRLLTEKTAPSFYAMLKGETTLCEHWDKSWPGVPNSDVSHSHPMFGSVLTWVYKNVAGLDLENVGDKKIIYAPKLIKEISSAVAFKKTPYGTASIAYRVKKHLKMTVKVPFNCKGELVLPNCLNAIKINGKECTNKKQKVIQLNGGEYRIIGEISY